MPGIVIDRIRSWQRFSGDSGLLTRVQISIETWEVAAADLQPQPVPLEKDIGCRPQVDCELVYPAGVDEFRLLLGTPIPCADNSFRQVLRKSVRPDIHKLGCKVGVNGRGFGEKLELDGPRYIEILRQRRRRID